MRLTGICLDLEATLAEQRDELEGFQDDAGRGKKHSIILRTQLSVRVHACIGSEILKRSVSVEMASQNAWNSSGQAI